jgi:L-lactate dehydrogenase
MFSVNMATPNSSVSPVPSLPVPSPATHPHLQVHWSSVSVAGAPLSTLLTLTPDERQTIATTTKSKAMDIIAAKGFTAYGISAAATSICETIVYNQHQIFPLSHWQEDLQCCLSLPAVWGRSGLVKAVKIQLNAEERALVTESAKQLRGVIEHCLKDHSELDRS